MNRLKIKIPKKFLFTDGDIQNYLKTLNNEYGNFEQELIATLTYKIAREKIYGSSTLISFPYRPDKEHEINHRPLLLAQDIGKFITSNIDQNSPIDAILVDPQNSSTSIINPLQIKYLGRGEYKDVTDEKFIQLLKHYKSFSGNGISLIIVLEGQHKIQLHNIVTWIETNNYPFSEVILIYPRNPKENVDVLQLKPSKDGVFNSIVLKKEELGLN